jgi:ribosomal protein S21
MIEIPGREVKMYCMERALRGIKRSVTKVGVAAVRDSIR